ncbi:hypothetical protein [Thermococcus gorgonarius]|uniref:Permease n=1 Tax=Thermococcus gorgonarius TaxID=71997 RepID=A0A2Z2M4J2_THEGO|nr:hypothetical protein [Thermococcus gorgonarius]ASJ00817.1 hypothetical protein A3K92_04640 [Thermococcus gorgonarius]
MLPELVMGFLFTLGWAVSYVLVLKQRSVARALLGVLILFGVIVLFTPYRFGGDILGWLIGISAGFFVGLQLVQKYGPEKPTDESVIAVFLLGPLIFALLLILVLVF